MIERRATHAVYFQFPELVAQDGLRHAIFTRLGGYSPAPYDGLNLALATGDDPERVRLNRGVVAETLALAPVSARPVHGAQVATIERDETDDLDALRARLRQTAADAMLTDVPGIALFWAFGDCAPVLISDLTHHAIALAHAGWRGTAAGIIPATLAAMHERYDTQPGDVVLAIGPAIGPCCYAVGEQVRDTFAQHALAQATARFVERAGSGAADGEPRLYLDIAESNRRQAAALGVPAERVLVSDFCTGCRTDLFYSHRCEGEPTGRFGAAIGLAH